ncbi:hypothetical protein HOLDEFILI_01133 [Holdemania filiformis DSM 12042]|uniref:Uncharacterized protein n=1 Tax=Holdemania filiformis DSM 12042 TaxID=545696 RepID=B9Y5Q1_9FIRM|nr:hypothetical protein HOLDEFILI_01133 [Holdemania filiformis DSM 12042]
MHHKKANQILRTDPNLFYFELNFPTSKMAFKTKISERKTGVLPC